MNRFKIGDRVVAVYSNYWCREGHTYVVQGLQFDKDGPMVLIDSINYEHYEWFFEFESVYHSPLMKALR